MYPVINVLSLMCNIETDDVTQVCSLVDPHRHMSLVAFRILYVNLGGYLCIKYANYFVFNIWTFRINLVFVHWSKGEDS